MLRWIVAEGGDCPGSGLSLDADLARESLIRTRPACSTSARRRLRCRREPAGRSISAGRSRSLATWARMASAGLDRGRSVTMWSSGPVATRPRKRTSRRRPRRIRPRMSSGPPIGSPGAPSRRRRRGSRARRRASRAFPGRGDSPRIREISESLTGRARELLPVEPWRSSGLSFFESETDLSDAVSFDGLRSASRFRDVLVARSTTEPSIGTRGASAGWRGRCPRSRRQAGSRDGERRLRSPVGGYRAPTSCREDSTQSGRRRLPDRSEGPSCRSGRAPDHVMGEGAEHAPWRSIRRGSPGPRAPRRRAARRAPRRSRARRRSPAVAGAPSASRRRPTRADGGGDRRSRGGRWPAAGSGGGSASASPGRSRGSCPWSARRPRCPGRRRRSGRRRPGRGRSVSSASVVAAEAPA